MMDAWEQVHRIWKRHSRTWLVRRDLRVRALGPDRSVEFGLGYGRDDEPFPGQFKFRTTQRNVNTMRELALALWAACDFVEESNPEWAAKGLELESIESFVVKE